MISSCVEYREKRRVSSTWSAEGTRDDCEPLERKSSRLNSFILGEPTLLVFNMGKYHAETKRENIFFSLFWNVKITKIHDKKEFETVTRHWQWNVTWCLKDCSVISSVLQDGWKYPLDIFRIPRIVKLQDEW